MVYEGQIANESLIHDYLTFIFISVFLFQRFPSIYVELGRLKLSLFVLLKSLIFISSYCLSAY